MEKIVVDTNVFISALLKSSSAPRQVMRLCLEKAIQPLMGNALFSEYEEVLAKSAILRRALAIAEEGL